MNIEPDAPDVLAKFVIVSFFVAAMIVILIILLVAP